MPRPVVAAAIVDSLEHPTVLLACSRAYPQELRGQFELPGGKIEEGEDAAAALEREIVEELGAHLRVGERAGGGARLPGRRPVVADSGRARYGRVARGGCAQFVGSARWCLAPGGALGADLRVGGPALDRRGPSYCRGRGCALRPVTRRASAGSGWLAEVSARELCRAR